jgi:isopenicillin N synthase-like dioxygenase
MAEGLGMSADYFEPMIDRHTSAMRALNYPALGNALMPGQQRARWTNDRWKSTLHRVVPVPQRRQSIAFFHNANWDAQIECLPMCLGSGESPRYQPMAAGPHLMSKFRSTVTPGANHSD